MIVISLVIANCPVGLKIPDVETEKISVLWTDFTLGNFYFVELPVLCDINYCR